MNHTPLPNPVIVSEVWRGPSRQTQSKDPDEATLPKQLIHFSQ
jgi:hypothetical protein